MQALIVQLQLAIHDFLCTHYYQLLTTFHIYIINPHTCASRVIVVSLSFFLSVIVILSSLSLCKMFCKRQMLMVPSLIWRTRITVSMIWWVVFVVCGVRSTVSVHTAGLTILKISRKRQLLMTPNLIWRTKVTISILWCLIPAVDSVRSTSLLVWMPHTI